MKLLDKDGLSYFWAKLKTLLNEKLDADAVSSTGTASTGWNNCRLSGGKIQYYNSNTTYSTATTSSAGLMSASDKTKLNGIAAGATKITVDAALSSTSTNPVQNKAVQAALAELVDSGAKNHLKLSASTQTINGVTFTVNADQTITVTGKLATAQTRAVFWLAQSLPAGFVSADRILTGCPAGGGSSTYRIVCEQSVNPYGNIGFDEGSGCVLKASTVPVSLYISVTTHNTLNLTFSPMVCSVGDYAISNAFKPYVPTNAELYAMMQN